PNRPTRQDSGPWRRQEPRPFRYWENTEPSHSLSCSRLPRYCCCCLDVSVAKPATKKAEQQRKPPHRTTRFLPVHAGSVPRSYWSRTRRSPENRPLPRTAWLKWKEIAGLLHLWPHQSLAQKRLRW